LPAFNEAELIGLADQIDAEAVMWFFGDEPEAARDVDPTGGEERVVRPEPEPCVPGAPGERDALVDQATA
jgi:hypothetical protein